MALLCIVLAFAAPSLGRSMRERHVADEAKRFLALTEYARAEAISQGVPMLVRVDVQAGRIGVEAKTGYAAERSREREFALGPDVHLEMGESQTNGDPIEYAPDGIPEEAG